MNFSRCSAFSFFARYCRPRRWGMICLGILFAAQGVRAQEVVVGFEDAEGFVGGTILPGRAGWTGTPAGPALRNLTVTTDEFYKGAYSLQANNAAGKYTFAQSPDLFEKGFTGVSFFLKNAESRFLEANQAIARWEVILGDSPDAPSAPRLVFLLRYTTQKTFNINIGSHNDAMVSSTSRNILAASSLNLTDWNEIDMDFDFSRKVLTIRVNGSPISSTIPLNPEKITAETRIIGLRFATPSSVADGVTYFDHVTARSGAKTPSKNTSK
jgi:hypothetical protein